MLAFGFSPHRTLLRLAQLSSRCNRATASFTANPSAGTRSCPPGCSFIMHQATSSQPGASVSYTACQLSQEDITNALTAHFVAACPGSRLEGYMSCDVDEEDFMPSAATWSVSSSAALSQDDIAALKRDACSAKPLDGKGLQGQGCRLVPAAPGDEQGSYCVPKAWSNDTVGALVQILAADNVTTQDWAWVAGSCGRDLASRVSVPGKTVTNGWRGDRGSRGQLSQTGEAIHNRIRWQPHTYVLRRAPSLSATEGRNCALLPSARRAHTSAPSSTGPTPPAAPPTPTASGSRRLRPLRGSARQTRRASTGRSWAA